jgi:hypothetical protein
MREDSLKLKMEIHRLLGNRCAACGATDQRVLQIHHKNDAEMRRWSTYKRHWVRTSNSHLYTKIRSDLRKGKKSEYELLCANCHVIRTIELGQQRKENQRRHRQHKLQVRERSQAGGLQLSLF